MIVNQKVSKLDSSLKRIKNERFREFVREAILEANSGDTSKLKYANSLNKFPVPPLEFLLDKHYLGLSGQAYQVVIDSYVELNSGNYSEAVLTGAIGSAKTTLALWTTAYQLYLVSCLKCPQTNFSLDKSSEILFIFQSLNTNLAKQVDFSRFKRLLDSSPYFQISYKYNPLILSELRFPQGVIVKPISGAETGAIGQNVFGGIIDEMNFMVTIKNSKQAVDNNGNYDQAIALYNSISRRRKSRFMTGGGKLPGILCLVSSKRYKDQFTDTKVAEAITEVATKGYSNIYVYDKTTWDVLPSDRFCGETFLVFTGSDESKPRIVDRKERVDSKTRERLISIPIEYLSEFTIDMMSALREIAGVSVTAMHPFITDTRIIHASFKEIAPVLSDTETDFKSPKLSIYPTNIINPTIPRWVHIDLGLTSDAAGVVLGHCPGFTDIVRSDGIIETLPRIHIDLTLAVRPPLGGEINFSKIRALLYLLRKYINIKWVSLDSYQSVDMIQTLRAHGLSCGLKSMDTTIVPYLMLRSAMEDGRIDIPINVSLRKELLGLESIMLSGTRMKIDHPPKGSKDISDALAGVVNGLTTRREVWSLHGVYRIPESVEKQVHESSLEEAYNTSRYNNSK